MKQLHQLNKYGFRSVFLDHWSVAYRSSLANNPRHVGGSLMISFRRSEGNFVHSLVHSMVEINIRVKTLDNLLIMDAHNYARWYTLARDSVIKFDDRVRDGRWMFPG